MRFATWLIERGVLPGGSVSFTVGDILTESAERCDAILCRGVLDDIVDEDARVMQPSTGSPVLLDRGVCSFWTSVNGTRRRSAKLVNRFSGRGCPRIEAS